MSQNPENLSDETPDYSAVFDPNALRLERTLKLFPDINPRLDDDQKIELVMNFFAGAEGPFRAYENPQRPDNYFVGQDRAIDPDPDCYRSGNAVGYLKNWRSHDRGLYRDCRPIYPPTPKNAVVFPQDMPRDFSERVLEILRARHALDLADMRCGAACRKARAKTQ
jgi:hypothetical protein